MNISGSSGRADSRNALLAGFFGWTLDAFDYFILVFVLGAVAKDFHKSIPDIALTLTASLAMRPVGAFLFGLMADRYGRRLPLMLDVLFYSVVEVCSGLAPNYKTFLFLRLLYGVGMGGEWGVGASLAMESVPPKWRGVLSGVLQEGYALGYLLAAVAYWTLFPHWGWRPLFFLGGLPALLTLFIRAKVKESDAWKAIASSRPAWGAYFLAVIENWKRFAYLVLLMAMMNFISHGTQDLYPTYLQQQHNFTPRLTSIITVVSMIGAIAGGILAGLYSDRHGRRRGMATAVIAAFVLIPLWVFARPVAWIVVGAFLMQFMVQGAWGIIPAHINELSPDTLRGFFPGFAYQLGVLVASSAPYLEAVMSRHLTYAQSLGMFAAIVLFFGAIVIALGPEAHRVAFGTIQDRVA
jgi:SHS family lactate transporter-like MFS transporter